MSTVINSINYQFAPDKETQGLCESIAKDINGNGVSLKDITVLSVHSKNLTVTTQFIWKIKVSIKHSIVSSDQAKDYKLHDVAAEAKSTIKNQGHNIQQQSLGKIELIKNINDDPEHYYKHSTIKLNGGQAHAYLESCNNHCDRGQVSCQRCSGRGTHKAITKKEDLLGTTENFSAINTCPDCMGKGTIDCKTCAGSGEIMQIYSIEVDATRKQKDTTNISDANIKKAIEQFLSRQSHMELSKHYLSPVVVKLKDIDQDRCSVIYQSESKYSLVSLSIKNKKYKILSFGDENKCIVKPKILDDFLPQAIKRIIGLHYKINSSRKYLKLHSLPIINILLSNIRSRPTKELELLLKSKSNGLLSQQIIKTIVDQLTTINSSMLPRFSFYAWLPIVITGIISGFYFNLQLNTPIELTLVSTTHIFSVAVAGTVFSKIFTAIKIRKIENTIEASSHEKLPIFISMVLLTASIFSTNLLTIEQRWLCFYTTQQKITLLKQPNEIDLKVISNPDLIRIAQEYLSILGYPLTSNGIYNKETSEAINDFQRIFGQNESKYLDQHTMSMLVKYAVIKEKRFTNRDSKNIPDTY